MSKQLDNMNPLLKDMINKAVELDMIRATTVLEFAGMEDKQIAFNLIETAYSNIHTNQNGYKEMCLLNDKFHKDIQTSEQPADFNMSEDVIRSVLDSDMFDNDVHDKIDYILTRVEDEEYTRDELLEMYDNL